MTGSGARGSRVADRYRLERRIGRGGAGAVWRAHDEHLDRQVAVKQIPIAADAQADSRERALREARATARLHMRNVVGVYDVMEERDHVYLIMELVDAPNLNTLVRRAGPLAPRAVAVLGLQMLDALTAAHRAGIVHRDVKPSNVLMDGDTARLTDFGIARLADDSTLTATGVVMGTPAYIAPEYARGAAVGPAADFYGLGATLYYAVEGRSPFAAQGSVPTVMAVINSEPRPPTRAGPLTDLLTALLAKDPDARPGPDEIRTRLREVVSAADAAVEAEDAAVDVPADVDDAPTDETVAPAEASDVLGDAVDVPSEDQPTPRRPRVAMLASVLALLLVTALTLNSMLDDDGQSASSDDASQRAAAPVPSETASAADGGVAGDPPPTLEEAASAGPSIASDDGDGTESANDNSDAGDDTGADGVLPVLDDVAVPGAWVAYAPDGAPYRLRHPPDWRVVRVSDTLTDIRDPNSLTYLRLDWVDEKRDPVGAWEQLEPGFAARHDSYENLGITPTTYKGHNAALWEYRYRNGGRRLHAYNLGVNADDYGFALNMQTSQENWDDAQDLWAQFLASYEFTGP